MQDSIIKCECGVKFSKTHYGYVCPICTQEAYLYMKHKCPVCGEKAYNEILYCAFGDIGKGKLVDMVDNNKVNCLDMNGGRPIHGTFAEGNC